MKALKVIHVFSNAATPLNPNSTRCVLQTQTTYGSSGKASGAIFWLYQLEKWRVSTRDRLVLYIIKNINESRRVRSVVKK